MNPVSGMLRNLVLLGLCAVALGGCSSFQSIEGPSPAFDVDDDIQQLDAQFGSATSIKAYYAAGPETVERRTRSSRGA